MIGIILSKIFKEKGIKIIQQYAIETKKKFDIENHTIELSDETNFIDNFSVNEKLISDINNVFIEDNIQLLEDKIQSLIEKCYAYDKKNNYVVDETIKKYIFKKLISKHTQNTYRLINVGNVLGTESNNSNTINSTIDCILNRKKDNNLYCIDGKKIGEYVYNFFNEELKEEELKDIILCDYIYSNRKVIELLENNILLNLPK
jgi:hypothetical protein